MPEAIRRAVAFLEERRQARPQDPLPGSREAARTWGLSEATFRRALRHLAGVAPVVAAAPKWERLRDAILAELEAGVLRPGQEIGIGPAEASRRGASGPTLRKAVRDLIARGCLEARPRGARVPHPVTRRALRVALVRVSRERRMMAGEAERERGFRRELELQALRRGLSLEIWEVGRQGVLLRDDGMAVGPGQWEGVLGAVVSTWGGDEAWERVLSPFLGRRLPIALWDERPEGGPLPEAAGLRVFECGYASAPGIDMVRAVHALGHRHAAWISPFQASEWSRQRSDGVRAAAAGLGMRLDSCVLPHVHHGEFEEESQALLALFDVDGLRRRLAPDALGEADRLADEVRGVLRQRRIRTDLAPLFAVALATEATAWICANDDVALEAWNWLAARGRSVPQEIGIVGFDDSLRAQGAGLTSYHFDEGSLAAACLRHLLEPPEPGRRAARAVHVPGFVITRRSIGRWAPAS